VPPDPLESKKKKSVSRTYLAILSVLEDGFNLSVLEDGFRPIVATAKACFKVLFSSIRSTIFNRSSSLVLSPGILFPRFLFFPKSSKLRFNSFILLFLSLKVSLRILICLVSTTNSEHLSSLIFSFSVNLRTFDSRAIVAAVFDASLALADEFLAPADVRS
jgi:hypothetical protein